MARSDTAIQDVVLTRRRFLALAGLATTVVACGPAASVSPSGAPAATTGPSGTQVPGSTSPSASPASVLRYGQSGAADNFNPWHLSGAGSNVYSVAFSRLLWKDFDGEDIPDLAESWQLSADGKSVELKLRSGVKWHDGRDFTAADYVTMYGYLSDPELAEDQGIQKVKGLLEPVTAVEAPDASTLVIRFAAPVPYVTDILDYFYAIRIDDKADPAFIASPPVATGPFKMTEFVPTQRASFIANPDYYLDGQPRLSAFDFNTYGGATNLLSNLQAGTVEGVLLANQAEAETAAADSNFYLDVRPTGLVWNLMVNCRKPPFDKQEVRQALSYSMNRQAMVDAAHFGIEKAVSSPFYLPSGTGYRADLVTAHAFDLDKAKALLDGAGVSGLTMKYPAPASQPNTEVYGVIWQADLAKIGVTMEIEQIDDARWDEIGGGGDPDTDVIAWNNGRTHRDGAVFWNTQRNYRAGEGEFSRFGYQNAELESLVAEGALETDPAKRIAIYQRLNEIVMEACHVIQIATLSLVWAWSTKVKEVDVDLIGSLSLGSTNIEA